MAAAQHLGDLARLRRVRDRIDREYAQPLDLKALAREVDMSPGELSQKFRLTYGETPEDHLRGRRIGVAVTLLGRGHLSFSDVCSAVGWPVLGELSTDFTDVAGIAPRASGPNEAPAGHVVQSASPSSSPDPS
jgi:AraC-like DNA-binding protein